MATSDRPVGVHFDKVLQTLRGLVQDMRQEFLESEIPISDDHQALHTFCEKLEFLLKFGIKERAGLLGGRRDLWQYLCKCLADRKNIHDGLRVIKANTELKTGVGRARCFVRYCLVHKCLADVLQQCVGNSSVTQQFYQSGSLLLNPSLTTTLITALYELCDVTFDLPPTGHDLDVSWPTFARHGMGGSWRPPSRSMSISSLSSYVSQGPSLGGISEDRGDLYGSVSRSSSRLSLNASNNYSEAVVGSVPQSPTMAMVSEDVPDLAGSPQQELQRENQFLRDTVEQLREQLAKNNASSDFDAEEIKQEDSNAVNTDHINDLEQRLEEVKKDYEKIFVELSLSQQRNRVFEIIEKELQSRIEEIEGTVKDYEVTERKYKSQIDELECKIESTTAANDRLSTNLQDLAATKSDEDSSNVDQASQLASQMAQLQISNSDFQSNMKENLHRISQLQEEITLLQEDKDILGNHLEQAEKEKTKLRTNIRKISEVEAQLKQKVEAATERETTLETVTEEMEALKERQSQVELLLEESEKHRQQAQVGLDLKAAELSASNAQLSVSKASMLTLKDSNETLQTSAKSLQEQLQDLRFQLSSQAMDKETTDKASAASSELLEGMTAQVTQQEAHITQLEDQIGIVQDEAQKESMKLSAQVSELEDTLRLAEEECVTIKEKLQLAESLATHETSAAESSKQQLQTTHELLRRQGEKSEQLTEDNKNLREKLIQLLKEKDALWQANQLLGEASTHNRNWMEDNTAKECLSCKVSFSLTKRRHHCRACGGIFCTGCSDNWVMMASSSKRVRVCDGCISLQSELAALVNPIVQKDQQQVAAQSETQQSKEGTKTVSCGPLPIGNVQPNDEDFSVISEDEVNASQLSSSADSSPAGEGSEGHAWQVKDSQATPTLTPHLLTTAPPTNAEVWVGAGTRVTIPVELPSGVTLSWHFTSEPKSISFAVLHHPKHSRAAPSDPETRVLIPTTRVASAQGPVKGKLMSKQPGVYTLVFDNSSSKLTAKKVTYSLTLIESISSSTESSKSFTQSPGSSSKS